MRFHLARAESRVDERGFNVPIDRQQRACWDRESIASALQLLKLARVVAPGASERFFIEARIAEQHCIAPSFGATDWPTIVARYDELVHATRSPVAELNRAIAMGYAGQLDQAVARVRNISEHDALRGSHLAPSVLAHLAALGGDEAAARSHAAEASRRGVTEHERRLLFRAGRSAALALARGDLMRPLVDLRIHVGSESGQQILHQH